MVLDTLMVVFTILSGIVAAIELIKYAVIVVKWIMKLVHNAKK